MDGISIIPIEMRVEPGWREFLDKLVERLRTMIRDGDILVLASKPLLMAREMYVELNKVLLSKYAIMLAEEYRVDPRMAQLVTEYSDAILGGVEGVILTYTGGVLTANAGIDRKNIGHGRAALPPHLLRGVANEIRNVVVHRLEVEIGVVITDSVVYPLRMGTRAYAVDIAGIKPLRDYRGEKDMYGRRIEYTVLNLADEIASAAHLVMGEGSESRPGALVRGIDILGEGTWRDLVIEPDKCLYRDLYPPEVRGG